MVNASDIVVVTPTLDRIEPDPAEGWVRIEVQPDPDDQAGTKAQIILLSPPAVDSVFRAGVQSRRAAAKR